MMGYLLIGSTQHTHLSDQLQSQVCVLMPGVSILFLQILLNACCPGWVRTDMAGPKAPKSPEEGAVTPVYLALLPPGATEPHGKFVSDKEVQTW